MIEVSKLSKHFNGTVAVDRLDFAVEQGEILGFLGPNGAGKTTTMRILTGFFPPSGGTAKIGGHDVLAEPKLTRRSLGYLPENVPLYQDMRVEEYLRFVGGVKGLTPGRARAEADRVMKVTGILERRRQLIKQLSKGFRQRVGLAQALMGDPPVLILDEPTIGLDPAQIVEMRSLIKSMAGQKTVILSSHILSEVAAICSRVLIINQGRLVAQGPPAMLSQGESSACTLRLKTLGPREELATVLEGLPGVESFTPGQPQPGEEGVCVVDLETSGAGQIQAEVAKAVVQAGLGLLELTPLKASLEEIFMKLTADKDQQPPNGGQPE
jgi:ABC-2 type transport system ATP-binding protein